VAIFGPTNPIKNSPLGDEHIVIRKGLLCSPCTGYDKKDDCKIPECLKAITVADVMEGIETKFSFPEILRYERKRAL